MSDSTPIEPTPPGHAGETMTEPIPSGANRGPSAESGRPVGSVGWILAAGILAGLVAWLGGEACRDLIKATRHAVNSKGIVLNVVLPRDQDVADARNAGLAFAVLGASLGAFLGAAGGLARGSRKAARSSAFFGSVAGAVACAAMSLALLPLYDAYRHRYPDDASRNLIFPVLVHAGIWSAAGAAAGAAYAMGKGTRGLMPRAVLGGLLGAAIAAGVYDLAGVLAFPDAATTRFVSTTWPTRLLARLAVGTLAAAGIAIANAPPRQRPVIPAA